MSKFGGYHGAIASNYSDFNMGKSKPRTDPEKGMAVLLKPASGKNVPCRILTGDQKWGLDGRDCATRRDCVLFFFILR